MCYDQNEVYKVANGGVNDDIITVYVYLQDIKAGISRVDNIIIRDVNKICNMEYNRDMHFVVVMLESVGRKR